MDLDKVNIEILADGTIKTTTDGISAANHLTAEQFLQLVGELAGGETTRVQRTDVKRDLKHVLEQHTHDGHTHSH